MLPFQSTHPLRGATLWEDVQYRDGYNFNPRTPCGVRHLRSPRLIAMAGISIHAPLAGCDANMAALLDLATISIHAPLAGCDPAPNAIFRRRVVFQSTHPLRGATIDQKGKEPKVVHFNPRTPCGVRRVVGRVWGIPAQISIHAPLAGCDCLPRRSPRRPGNFNPRTPCGVRPTVEYVTRKDFDISIHAPLAGCDLRTPTPNALRIYFNPRTPCGVRPARLRPCAA